MRLVWVVIPLVLIGIIGVQESFAQPATQNIWITDLSHNPISEGKSEETFLINVPIAYNYHGQCVWQDNIVKNLEIISEYDDEKCQTSFVLILQVTHEDNIVELLVWQNLTLTAKENKTIQIFWTPSTYGNYEVSGYFWKSLEDYTALTSKKTIVFPINEIQCNDSFTQLHKFDNSPVCVTSSTAEKLIERGWMIQQSIDPSNISESDVFYTLDAPSFLERHPIERTDFGTKFGTPVIVDLNSQTQFVTNTLENQLFYVANVIPDDVVPKYIFEWDTGIDGRINYTIVYLPSEQDVASDESYGFVYGRGGIIVSVNYFDITEEQTDIFMNGLLGQRPDSTSKLIDHKRIFYQNGTYGSSMSTLVIYDPILNLSTHVTSYYHDANILEQLALSMIFE